MPGEPTPDLPSEPAPEPLDVDKAEERLEQLGEKIDQVKRSVHEDIDPEPERTYADSGATPEEDDQTITPPG
jgi:hypothetical protein